MVSIFYQSAFVPFKFFLLLNFFSVNLIFLPLLASFYPYGVVKMNNAATMYKSAHIMRTIQPQYMTEYLKRAQCAEITEIEKVLRVVSGIKGKPLDILDIGVGDGRLPAILSGLEELWSLIGSYDGIDNSHRVLQKARRIVNQRNIGDVVALRSLDAQDLPALEKTYDLALLTYFTAGNFAPEEFSFETGEDGLLSGAWPLHTNDKLTLVLASAYSRLCPGGVLLLGSTYIDNNRTREKQEAFYRNCGMTVVSRPTDTFAATQEGFWSQRFTEQQLRDAMPFAKPGQIDFIPLDTYDFARAVVVAKD
jgi:SAM-dependent methyltransferase